MLLDDARSIKAALATMNPTARYATQLLASNIAEDLSLLDRNEDLQQMALRCCAAAFVENGGDLDLERARFVNFLDDHGVNVLDIAVSIIICIAKDANRKRTWGNIGKAAAAVGLVGLGAFFG